MSHARLACLLALTACSAPRESRIGAQSAPASESGQTSTWEGLHGGVKRGVRGAAAWLDSFLSDERSLAEENRSWVSVRAEAFADQRGQDDLGLHFGGRLVLPELEERLHVAFTGDPEESERGEMGDAPAKPTPVAAPQETREPNLSLQYMLRRTKRNHVRTELGVRFEDLEPDPYLGARWRHTLPLGDWQARATERLRAYADAGFDSRTTLDLERLVGEIRFFRATTHARWREDEPGLEYGQKFSLFQRVDEVRIVTFEWSSEFVTEPEEALDELALRFRVAQRLDKGRFLLEIAPQIAWRNQDDYEPSAGLFLSLELLFGREQSP